MKIKKFITLVSAMALTMTNITAISVQPVAAEETGFFEDFTSYEEVSDTYSLVDAMNDLYTGGWSVATDNGFKERDEADNNQKFAKIVKDGDNKVLELSTTNAIGRKLDTSTEKPSGSFEISFKFKPAKSGKFDFSLNSFGETTDMKHNILYSNSGMKMGHRTSTINVPMTQVGTAENVWYSIKCIVNNDGGYYSVELYKEDALVARRAVINYAGNENIGFLKLSGLGKTVYIDDVSIKPCKQETLIYEDNFDSYSKVKLATSYAPVGSGITEAQSREGMSFFEGYTPWRALKALFDVENSKTVNYGDHYDLVHDDERDSQVLQLGGEKNSSMILMPLDGEFLTKESQAKRGKLKLTYKFRDYTDGTGFATAVDALGQYDYSGKWSWPPQLAIMEKTLGSPAEAGKPYLKTSSSPVKINTELWYDAEVIFDVVSDNVSVLVKEDSTGKEIAKFDHKTNWIDEANAITVEKIKAINFRALSGSAIYIDDFKLEYYMTNPEFSGNSVIITDYKGEKVEDKYNVPAAVTGIELPFGSRVTEESTNTGSVQLRDSKGVYVNYSPVYGYDSYTIVPKEILTPGETYTLTVPKTVENIFGLKLGADYTYSFKVDSDYPELITLASTTIKDLKGLNNGLAISAKIGYANSSNAPLDGMYFIAYYGDGMLLATSSEKLETIGVGDMGTKTVSFTVPGASALDVSKVDKISLCLWKGFENSVPYGSEIDIEKTSADELATEEALADAVSEPVITYSYFDSVMNISGTAKKDSKFLTVQILKPGSNFAAGDSLGSADADNLVFYRAQIPVENGKYSLDVRFDIKGNTESTLLAGYYPTMIYLDDKKLYADNVYLASNLTFKDAYKELNDAAEADNFTKFKEVLNTKRSALNFDNDILGNTVLEDEIRPYFEYIKNNRLNAENEVKNSDAFYTYIAVNYINNNQIDSIDDINKLLISDEIKALCNKTITTDVKNRYFTSLLKNTSDWTQLEPKVKKALILSSVAYGNGYGELKDVLEVCGSEIDITTPISVTACRNLMGNTYSDTESFKRAYDEAAEPEPQKSSSPSSSPKVSVPISEANKGVPEAKPITKTFNDIDNYGWAMTEILALADRNIISGVAEGRFEPSRNIKREEFAKILVGALGASDNGYNGNVFADASDSDWFVKYINIAASLGIVNGIGNGNFGTGQAVTRQDMAVMIYNALKYRNVDMPIGEFKFDDDGQIADYAKDAVSALHAMGAINGMTEKTFVPYGLATRAQAAKIVYSVLEELQGEGMAIYE